MITIGYEAPEVRKEERLWFTSRWTEYWMLHKHPIFVGNIVFL